MITIFLEKIKAYSQKNYNIFFSNLEIHKLTCPCGQIGLLIKHGKYNRSIKTPEGLVPLEIQRLKCKVCLKTHAIMPEFIVPYSRILLEDHISIIENYENNLSNKSIMLSNPFIDENNIVYVIKQYLKHWKEKLIAFDIKINQHISQSCFSFFKRQFMQIKRCLNILFLPTT